MLEATDSSRVWKLGGAGDVLVLKGTQAALLGWLIGRSDGSELQSSTGMVPVAPRWL